MPVLTVVPREGEPYSLKIAEKEITIGRSPSNALPLEDACCSAVHASIFPKGRGYAIKDLGSKNGTSVNGRRVTTETELKKGDRIRVGDTNIRFDGESITWSSQTVIKADSVLKPPATAKRGEQPAQREADFLDDVIQALYCDQPLDEFLDRIMNVVIEHVSMDRGILMLKDEKTGKLGRKFVKVPDESRPLVDLVISESIVKAALAKNCALLISDTQNYADIQDAPSVILLKIHSAMCVPLLYNHEVIGVIYADRIAVFGPFNETDLRDLTLLAGVAANRIIEVKEREAREANDRIIKQLHTARGIQQNLLPQKDPTFEPFEISGSARPCRQVGGDYFDFIDLGPNRLGLVIADVSGTGFSAAILMSYLSGLILPEMLRESDLAELTARLNDRVHKKSGPEVFISFFVGIVDREKEIITYANAGHNPPFLLDSQGRAQTLDGTGICLGMLSGMKYETRTVPLQPGNLLCLYTDGVTEAMNCIREQFGEERLVAVLRENAGRPAHDIIAKIHEAVSRFTENSPPDDDITLVILKRN
jgi:sigma-B regulation protein RsbU (phosphoserine phosphatase)